MAIRNSEISAQAMGVNPARTKAAAFGLSCMATGWAGALMGHFFYTFNHEVFTVVISIQLLLMIVIGGLGAIQGAWYPRGGRCFRCSPSRRTSRWAPIRARTSVWRRTWRQFSATSRS